MSALTTVRTGPRGWCARPVACATSRGKDVQLALLMDISAACGSHVIYNGPRRLRVYRAGVGVAAAMLVRSGIPVVSQRDFRTLALVLEHLGRPDLAPADAIDHHETEWYRSYFAS